MALISWTVTAATDATADQYNNLRKDVLLQAGEYVTSGGSANAQTFTVDAQITAYVDGMCIPFKAGFTNTGAATGNVNGIGAKNIKLPNGSDILSGSIVSGRIYTLRYDGTNLVLGGNMSFSGVTCIPTSVAPLNLKSGETYDFTSSIQTATNTYQFVGQILIPFDITINKFTIGHVETPTDGTYDISLYSYDGQTRLFTKETATLTGNGTAVTTTLDAPVSVTAGVYYIGINPNGTADVNILYWSTGNVDSDATWVKAMFVVSGEQTIMWRLTITAGIPATSFDPTSDITFEPRATIYIRFDS